jgi:hypothetical protein
MDYAVLKKWRSTAFSIPLTLVKIVREAYVGMAKRWRLSYLL